MLLQTFSDKVHFTRGTTLAVLTLLGFSALYCLCFSLIFPADKLLAPGDGWRTFVPYFYAKKALWSSLICAGYPTIGDPQFQFWYPLTLIFQGFRSYNGLVLSAYIVGSSCAYLYTYIITKSKFAAIISGLAFGMSGFLLAHFEHPSMSHSAVWVPLILAAIEKLYERINIFWFIAGALAICLTVLGGHPQISVYALGLGIVYAAYTIIRQKNSRFGYFMTIAAMFTLGMGLAAIQIIPTIEWMYQSTRELMPYHGFVSHPIELIEFWQLIYPNLSPKFHCEISCYMGILPLLLFFTSVLIRKYNIHFWFWLGISLFAICLMLGDVTPLAKIIYHVPPYNLFRCICRHALELTVALSVLSGIIIKNLETVAEEKSLFKYGSIACISFVIVASLATLCCANVLQIYVQKYANSNGLNYLRFNLFENSAVYIPILISILSIVGFLIWLKNPRATWRKILLVGIFICDLFLSNMLFRTELTAYYLPSKSIRQNPSEMGMLVKKLLYKTNQRLLPIPTYEHMYAEMAENGLAPNLPMLWNIPIASGYPIRLKRYNDLTQIKEFGFPKSLSSSTGCELDLACIKYIMHPDIRILDMYSDLSSNSRFIKIATLGNCTLFENLHVMQKAWLTRAAVCLTGDQVLRTVHSGHLPDGSRFEPAETVLVEDALAPKINNDTVDGTIDIVKLEDTVEEFRSKTNKSAMLVVSSLYYPGWQVRVDDEAANLYIADYAFRAVYLKPGEHTIKFEYRPQSLFWGILISSFSLIILSLIWLFSKIFTKWRMMLHTLTKAYAIPPAVIHND